MTTTKLISMLNNSSKMRAYGIYQFSSREYAFSFAAKTIKMSLVLLGDNGKFWVCSGSIGNKLNKLGYEYAI